MGTHKPTHYERHGQLCILSIDDDAVNLLVIEQLLSQEGWRVRPAPAPLWLTSHLTMCRMYVNVNSSSLPENDTVAHARRHPWKS